MIRGIKKLILYSLLITMPLQPFLSITSVRAEETSTTTAESDPIESASSMPIVFSGDSSGSQPPSLTDFKYDFAIDKNTVPTGLADAVKQVLALNPDPDKKFGMGLESGLSINKNPRLVINPSDLTAIKTLAILGGADVTPDFSDEYQALFDNLSAGTKSKNSIGSVDDLKTFKLEHPDDFLALISEANAAWLKKNGGSIKDLVKTKPDLISKILGISIDEANTIVNYKSNGDTESDAYNSQRYDDLMNQLDDAIAGLKIDLRVLQLLNYLVAPKSQGGAGHWRIQVRTILAGYSSPRTQFKKESDINYVDNATTDALANGNRTAADIGQNRAASEASAATTTSGSTTTTTGATTIDNSAANTETNAVDSYEASFSTTGKPATEEEKRISVHSNGQAVDIAQIDDIRCTLIKKKRIGGDSVSKYSQRPIKLAWQTTQGYIDSGGQADQNADMAKILRDYAQSGIRDLIEQFGGDISNYDGDLSSASFSDIAMLLGKSLFGEILNSPGGDLKGYSFGDTLQKMGAMYFADYLGLPREMFINRHYDNLDQFQEAIGAAAIEKRMNLPIGTFDGDNLNDMLRNIGQRKIEYEMNLKAHDLDLYFVDVNSALIDLNQRTLVIGATVIENELSLLPGSYLANNVVPANFSELKSAVGKYKADIIFKDPTYVDGVLHLDPGTTKQLVAGQNGMTPAKFAEIVGKKRLDDTVYGLQFLAMNDAAYEIPPGTFQKVLDGDSVALTDIGIAMMARTFTTTDLERQAFIQWIKANKDKDPNDPNACQIPDNLEVTNVVQATVYETDLSGHNIICSATTRGSYPWCTPDKYGQPIVKSVTTTPKVTISEKKALTAGFNTGDMFSLFGCNKGNGHAVFNRIGSNILYFAIIQQALNPTDKIKLDLTELNPQFRSSDPQKEFYVTRIYKLITLKNQIKSNWSADSNDPEYIAVKNAVSSIVSTIEGVISNPDNITDINSAKAAARNLAVSINSFSGNVQQIQTGANRYRNKINGMLIDIQELVKTVSEIMEGREIKTTNSIRLNQIPDGAFGGVSVFTTQSTAVLNKPVGTNTKTGIRPTNIALMAILARKLNPTQFFINLAATKIEGELNLPTNSMIYFVNNYESKGLGTVDAFVAAAGQARIEEEFGMPANYFQGPLLSGTNFALAKPDFRNDMYALEQYLNPADIDPLKSTPLTLTNPLSSSTLTKANPSLAGTGQILSANASITNPKYDQLSQYNNPSFSDQYSSIFETDGAVKTTVTLTEEQQKIVDTEHAANELLWMKITQPKVFDKYVAKAEKAFAADMQTLIDNEHLNKYLENDIDQVVMNIENFKLNDASRSPSADLLFRMGISGSFSALESDSSTAWLATNPRASQIDRLFGIAQGSTKSLLTSKKVSATYSHDSITPDEKNILSARMGVTSAAIDKLLDVLNGNLPASVLNNKALDIVAVGDNPYLKSDTADVGSDDCSIGFSDPDPNGFVTSSTLIMNSYLYVDADGTHSFGSQTAALNYAQLHTDKQLTYINELGRGLNKLMATIGGSATGEGDLQSFVNGGNSAYGGNESLFGTIQQKTGISKDTLDKLFTRSNSSDITRPLVAYKKAVGTEVLFQTLSYKLFGDIGLRITRDSFHTSDFFDIMHGNFKSLEKMASSLIDDQLDLPQGSTQSIIFASSSAARSCALSEVGANVLGHYLGIDYISLHGNIYQNLGRSNLERILKIPKNTFAGKNIGELEDSLGEINLVQAFSIPIDKLNFEDEFTTLFDQKTANGLKGYSNSYKLQQVQNLISANAGLLLDSANNDAYNKIKQKLRDQIAYASTNLIDNGEWKNGENRGEINKFMVRVNSLDSTFRLKPYKKGEYAGTTVNMLAERTASYIQETTCSESGVIQIDYCKATPTPGDCGCTVGLPVTITRTNKIVTPNEYVSMVANKTALDFALLKGMEFFGLDINDPRNVAIAGILTGFQRLVSTGNAGYAELFGKLETIFSINLDEKAGLDQGTFKAIIENPGNTFSILMPQATRKIDEQLKLDPNDTWSVSGVYRTYLSPDINLPANDEYWGIYTGSYGGYGGPYRSPGTSASPTNPADFALANKAARAGECAYTAEDQTTISNLNTRAQAIQDWMNLKGQIVLIDQNTTSGYLYVTQPSDFRNDPAYIDQQNALAVINAERTGVDRKYNSCKEANRGANSPFGIFTSRFTWNTFKNIAEDYASDKIHEAIWDATKGTIYMPGQDIKQFFINGDMRYFWAAGIAYTANIVVNAANTSLTDPLPPAYHITYDDIKLATMSDFATEEYAADAATYDYLNNNGSHTYADSLLDMQYGGLYYGDKGDFVNGANTLFSQSFNSRSYSISGPPRDTASLTAYARGTFDKTYDTDSANNANAESQYTALSTLALACRATYDKCDDTSQECKKCKNDIAQYEELTQIRDNVKAKVRNYFRESMQFRIFDGIFWGKDHNVFPGFTYALIRGNSNTKSQAIATYIKNGIMNGEFFGQAVPWLQSLDPATKLAGLQIGSFILALSRANDPDQKALAFDTFAGQEGFNWLNNYISVNSEKWFGFNIDPQMAGGLVLGGFTGHWGKFSTDTDNDYKTTSGKLIPSLGKSVFLLASGRLFTWADTQLGWAPGTAFKIYDFGKTIYDMNQTVKQINNVAYAMAHEEDVAGSLSVAREANPDGARLIDQAGGDPEKAKVIAKAAVGALVVNQISAWITNYITTAFGKQIAGLEEKYGLVPGSTQILIGAAVSYQVGVVVFNNTSLLASAPTVAMLWFALAVFVLVNLFGVYKVELKCSADGYYPRIESPSPNLDSASGLGVWNGMNPTVTQAKTVAAAQYKAKQLIIDVLNMHNNPNYTDIYPSQIMTGRDEDVLALNQQIADNMCSIIDKNMPAIHGICDGDTLAGVWYDSYVATRGYTHIGF